MLARMDNDEGEIFRIHEIFSHYTESPAEAEFVWLTAGVGTIHLFL
jgi:hypothetical protein